MRKEVFLGVLFLCFILIPFVSSAEGDLEVNEKAQIDKAYACLDGKITNKSAVSLQEAIFGTLAVGSRQKLSEAITSNKNDREACWPKACKIKETAQVALAYSRSGGNTNDIFTWLESKKAIPNELTWYLEIDSVEHTASACKIRYDGREYNVRIQDDMRLSGSAGSCLSLSSSGYWLKINNNCLTKSFEVSCDQNFVTSIVYQKTREGTQDCLDDRGNTCYVSSKTSSAASLGTTNESVRVACLKTGSICDYEGTLWAAYALQKLNKDVSDILPYLVALADDNQPHFPSSFLYILTGDEEYYSQIIQNRKQNQFWEFTGNPYSRFYDTSLGMLSLGSSSEGQVEAAKTQAYLLGIQGQDGCWNNGDVLDTSFILYSGWVRGASQGSNGGGSSLVACVEGGFSCERLSECTAAGGVKKEGFECASAASICCSVAVPKASCEEEGGRVCSASQECNGQVFESGDGACCLGSCVEVDEPALCEINGGVCMDSCEEGYQESSESCSTGGVCCMLSEEEDGGSAWGWILLLLILIAIVAAAIYYRDKLKLWWFKRKGKTSSTPVTTSKPGVPPSSGAGANPLRNPFAGYGQRPVPRQEMRPRPQPKSAKDSEMEETLKKLREMSK